MPFTVGVSISGANGHLLSMAATAAERAERLGFDSIEFAESAHDPFLACAIAAEHTSRIQIHTSVAIAFPRSPMITAMLAWDLQHFSKGRFVLGLGTQVKAHSERRFSVPWTPPAPRIREYVLAMRTAWRTFQEGVPLRFEGEHYRLSLMNANFNPGPIEHPVIPVELAAVNPNNAAVAGEVCSGIKLHPLHTAGYLRDVLLPAVHRGQARPATERRTFNVRGGGLIGSGATPGELDRAAADVRRWIAFYGSTRAYEPIFEQLNEHDLGARLRSLAGAGRWAEMPAAVPDGLVEGIGVVAPYDALADALRSRYDGLVDHIAFNDEFFAKADDATLAMVVSQLHAERPSR
ncbi:MAG: TIGR03617 family F420-dependent LLM class oxidoreductase [Tepidiformaceae bacterium]